MDDDTVVIGGGVLTLELVSGLTSPLSVYELSCGGNDSAFTYLTNVEMKARNARAPVRVSLLVDSSSANVMAKEMRDYSYGVLNPTSGR